MTKFKPGDRVRHTAAHDTGVIVEGFDGKGHYPGEVPVLWSDGEVLGAQPENLELITRPLVGPAPKVEAPVFVAPFEYRGGSIMMADGSCAFDLKPFPRGEEEVSRELRDEFGEFVAAALNARVFGEE